MEEEISNLTTTCKETVSEVMSKDISSIISLEDLEESKSVVEDIVEEPVTDNEVGTLPSYLKNITDKTVVKGHYDDVAKEIETRTLIEKLKIVSKLREWFGLPKLKGQEESVMDRHLTTRMEKLITLLQDCNEAVTNVRIASLKSETERLDYDGEMRKQLLLELEKEDQIAKLKFNKINEEWDKIKHLNDPLDIHNATNLQRDKCVALLERKDAVIEKLKKIIAKTDDLFLDELRKQEDEVNVLIDRIDEQLGVISDAYRKELELIEVVSAREKEKQLFENRERWEKFIEEKDEIETEVIEQRFQLMDQHKLEFDKYVLESQESLRQMTFNYMKKIRELTLKVEEMRGICDLNAQKLKYNYNLLQKREEENKVSKRQLIASVSRLKDKYDQAKTKAMNEKIHLEGKLNQITEDLKVYGNEITLIDKKMDNLSSANCKKYFQLWEYNQKVADDLIQKIFDIEKIFYEQHLCVPWNHPECTSFPLETMPSYIKAKNILFLESDKKDPLREKRLELFRKAAKEKLTPEDKERRLKVFKIIFDKLSDKIGFLREDSLEIFMESIPDKDKDLIRIDQVLNSLGITNEEDMVILTRYLMPYLYCRICDFQYKREDDINILRRKINYEDDLSDVLSPDAANNDRTVLSDMVRNFASRFETCHDVVKKEFCEMDPGPPFITGDARDGADNNQSEIKEEVKKFYFDEDTLLLPYDVKQKQKLLGLDKYKKYDYPSDFKNSEELCQSFQEKFEFPPEMLSTDRNIISCKKYQHDLVMPTVYLLRALKDFMIEFYDVRKEIRETYINRVLSKKRHTLSRLLDFKDVEQFWDNYKNYFGTEQQELWNTFQMAMRNYISDLRMRHKLNEDIIKIKKTNAELTRLLQRYLEPRRNLSIFESIIKKVDHALDSKSISTKSSASVINEETSNFE